MSKELNLEEGITRQFSRSVSRNVQRGTKSTIEIRELPQSCYHLMAEGLVNTKKTLDPRKPFGFWVFLISCVIAISVDPLFFYVPVIDSEKKCLGFDRKLRISAIVLYAIFGFFYMTYVNFLLPTSSTKNEAKPYLLRFSIIDFLVLFPTPLVLLTLIIEIPKMGVDIFLLPMSVFLFQYLLRVIRISVLFTEATKTSGILAEAKWTKAAFNLLLYLQGGHVFGGLWYFFAVEREVVFWKGACGPDTGYVNGSGSFYCDDIVQQYKFRNVSCTTKDPTFFDFGIFEDALQSGIVETNFFLTKLLYCLRWGVQTLSCFGQNLQPSTYFPENFFVICITIYAVLVFVFLVGNIQTYLQSETIRSEELRLQGRETEQWMSFWKLSEKLQKEVKKFQPYKGLETKIIHAEDLLNKLPRDLQKNIKCELCLDLLRKVGEFGKLSESALEDLCDQLKPVSFNKCTRIAREGDPVDEMLIVVQGKLRSYTSRDITTGSLTTDRNNCKNILLKDGDICGKELVIWVHADPYLSSLPVSTTTILAVTDVEAFAVMVEDLQNVFAKEQAVHFIQSFWRFRRVLRSRKNVQTST